RQLLGSELTVTVLRNQADWRLVIFFPVLCWSAVSAFRCAYGLRRVQHSRRLRDARRPLDQRRSSGGEGDHPSFEGPLQRSAVRRRESILQIWRAVQKH